MASGEVDEVDGGRMQVDVEAVFDAPEDGVFVDVVVAGVDDAEGAGPAFLGCADGGPEDALPASTGVAARRTGVSLAS